MMLKQFENIISNEVTYIWICNLGIENSWDNSFDNSMNSNLLLNNIEELSFLLAKEQDCVVLHKEPEMSYLESLRDVGFSVSRYIVLNSFDYSSMDGVIFKNPNKNSETNNYCLIAYAADEKIKKIAELNGCSYLYFNENLQLKNHKIHIRNLLISNGINYPKGFVVEDLEQLEKGFDKLKDLGFERIILKKPYGASGKGSFILDNKKQINSCYRYYMKKSNTPVILEGFYENNINFNYQIYINDDGRIDMFFLSDQIIKQLVYSGSYFPTKLERKHTKLIIKTAEYIGEILYNDRIRGVVGIDGFIANDEVFPAIDVNVRFTMSTYFTKIPSIFGNELKYKIVIRDLFVDEALTYEKLKNIMIEKNIFYNKTEKSGVFIILSGPLPRKKNEQINKYLGRIYSLVIGSDWSQVEQLSVNFDQLLDKLEE